MTVERSLRLLAGVMILISVGLAYWVSLKWLLLSAFVGLNLLQSGFTNWCPAMSFFRKIGLPEASVYCGNGSTTNSQ